MDFPEGQFFLESVYFHSEILGVNNFGLVLGDCLVNAKIFINKYIVKLSIIFFLWIVKDPQYDNMGYFWKIMHILSSSKASKKILDIKNQKHTHWPYLKKRSICMSQISYERVQPVGLISLSCNWVNLHNAIDHM